MTRLALACLLLCGSFEAGYWTSQHFAKLEIERFSIFAVGAIHETQSHADLKIQELRDWCISQVEVTR